MDSSFKTQWDIKNNAEDLHKYAMDLRNWEDEMKAKEVKLKSAEPEHKNIPPPRNRIKRSTVTEKNCPAKSEKKPKKISAYDYSSWDKFDADKACDDVDKEETSGNEEVETTSDTTSEQNVNEEKVSKDQDKLKLIDEAFYEKELGNQFVKKGKWDDAIQCYTRAIQYDSRNAIFYANRALCFIKLKNLKAAEVDSTVAIQLDPGYVKAYQRRALARTALGQLPEAKADYLRLLDLEPNNQAARTELDKIEKKLGGGAAAVKETFNPKSIFEKKEERRAKPEAKKVVKVTEEVVLNETKSVPEVKEKIVSPFRCLPEGCSLVSPVKKPPHLRSKTPLKRIAVKQVATESNIVEEVEDVGVSVESRRDAGERVAAVQEEGEAAGERAAVVQEAAEVPEVPLEAPRNCVQFTNQWRTLRGHPAQAYTFLKRLKPSELGRMFGDSLESDLMSEVVATLAEGAAVGGAGDVDDADFLQAFLLGLAGVKRFSSLVMFMTPKDKQGVGTCIETIGRTAGGDKVARLRQLYEL